MALIEISDRFALFRQLAMQVWNEGYVTSFTGDDAELLPEASECFDEICAYLWGNVVLKFFSIYDIYSSFANSQVRQVNVLIQLRREAEMYDGAAGITSPPLMQESSFRFVRLFDWGLYQPRPFEWLEISAESGRSYFVRLTDVTGIYVEEPDSMDQS